MSSHTLGPWHIVSNMIVKMINDSYFPIAEVNDWGDETISNARLIAVAPDLLKALENLADYIDERAGDNECRPLENARAAIAKARGQT